MATQTIALAEILDSLTVEGELYEKLDNDAVRCYACGHRCLIREGREGICHVRFNRGGTLYVPHGYVGALQVDPTEKKPFFHVLPGSETLTFGMLGCDLHCSYCFTGDTVVVTDRGPIALADAFDSARQVDRTGDAEIAYPINLRAVAASGTLRKVRAIFKHPYRGPLVVIRPYYLPELRCTPDHRVYATDSVDRAPERIEARHLTDKHYLAIPRRYEFSSPQVVDAAKELSGYQVTYRVPWNLSAEERQAIAEATARGESSRQIGASLGKSASYIRHVRGKIARGRAQDVRTSGPLIEDGSLRFPNEHRPGIPLAIPLDADMARLLGYYCAEGSVVSSKNRPNSHTLNFSFSHAEPDLVEDVRALLNRCLGVEASRVVRTTTLAVSADKASAALLFKALAGGRSSGKHVPQMLFHAPRSIVQAFLDAYVQGDGHRYTNGKASITTVSRSLAYGIAWLVLKLGYLPSVYDTLMPEQGVVQGRRVERASHQYVVVWYPNASIRRKVIETEDYYLVPVRQIRSVEYDGDVYNMEIEEEHNYLAGFFLVSNCQNWLTSQALRDPNAGVAPQQVTPDELVKVGRRYGAKLFGSSYNEPLITSEWAVAVFKAATDAGFRCVYISNGNATPEVLDYIRPYVVGYKIDLKSMNDKNYRKLGAELNRVLNGVKMVHERGFWLEIVTLVIPGFNDSNEELWDAARFIASLSPDIPWHVTAFHKDYKMTDPDNTDVKTLIRAAEIGQEAGLRYVYAGNLPGHVGPYENTYCPNCHELLIQRWGYRILKDVLTGSGRCPKCSTSIPGIWI
ncbi:MAG TPA: radical SAM protein [Anaerolineae bacterium]